MRTKAWPFARIHTTTEREGFAYDAAREALNGQMITYCYGAEPTEHTVQVCPSPRASGRRVQAQT
jgi:hypothetical protein